ncbi:MAG: peptide-methionine (S)-S-oxide reductase MsrA [Parvularculaceae bacterium]|nr:peptide-methionine (S)-S-oxide reductase MsrA [Parvularculaceae bacterium]
MMKHRTALISALAALVAANHSAIAQEPPAAQEPAAAKAATAVFAGGCFWCVESDFEKLEGVSEVISGYSGGLMQNPTYKNHEGHIEAAEIFYDPSVVSYRALVDYLLRHIDPLDDGGQFCDRGHSYTSAIFASNADEWADAKAAIAQAETELGKKIVTPIEDRGEFWRAEDYHQDYYKKNPLRYRYYRTACRRDARVRTVWGDSAGH